MRRLLVLTLAVSVLVAACGGSGEGTTSAGEPASEGPVAQVREMLAKSAYRPQFTNCVLAKIEKTTTPQELEEIGELPRSQELQRLRALGQAAVPGCLKPGEGLVDPHATHAQMGLVREDAIAMMRFIARKNGLDAKQESCVVAVISKAPDKNLIAIIDGDEQEAQATLAPLFDRCLHQ